MKLSEITLYLESIAPLSTQENYDNSGLVIGSLDDEINKILLTLDVTEKVIDEAIEDKCNIIIAHHPLIFKPIKSITGENDIEKSIIKAIKNNISIYISHTNLDHSKQGVNFAFAQKLTLQNTKILSPIKNALFKLITYIPKEHLENVLNSLHDAGAGKIGEYSNCSFQSSGTGTFKPSENANPFIGNTNYVEHVDEIKVEVLVEKHLINKVLNALKQNHPYEEVAYYILPTENKNQDIGAGIIGYLPNEITLNDFFKELKTKLNLKVIKHTKQLKEKIKKVAICTGSGKFLLEDAKKQHADIFISSDFKYHDFFETDNLIVIADIGHYESEIHTKELFYDIISKKFPNIALVFSRTDTNPISYYT